ncbi:hypothetical protein [Sporomusa silvacetica]|nr:hypothetical protein [Sporomusa silvacetica]
MMMKMFCDQIFYNAQGNEVFNQTLLQRKHGLRQVFGASRCDVAFILF